MDSRPIGVFDSGLGGLTVVKEIIKELPKEDIIYLGDTARVPYGTRSKEVVVKFSLEDANFLVKRKVKAIVIACNTASSFAFDAVKKNINLPVFEVIKPAAREAVKKSKTKKIGVIGTRGTIGSGAYRKAILSLDRGSKVFELSTPLLVPLIEEGEIKGSLISSVIKKYLSFFDDKKIDTLILGCTHYPIIERVIRKQMGYEVSLINPGIALSKFLKRWIEERGLKNGQKRKVSRKYYITDMNGRFSEIAEMFLGKSVNGKIRKAIFG
jgi:glutamate racemase